MAALEGMQMDTAAPRVQENNWYQTLFRESPLAMLVCDEMSLAILDANQAANLQYGYAHGEWRGMSLNDLARANTGTAELSQDGCAARHVRKNGSQTDVRILSRPVMFHGTRALLLIILEPARLLGASPGMDMETGGKDDEEIKRLAFCDEVTGLPNRLQLRRRLEESLSACCLNHPIALMILDLINFSEVNYTFGYANGDRVLKEAGQRIHQALDAADTVARVGSAQFAVLVCDASAYNAVDKLRHILGALEQPFSIGEIKYELRTCIGVAMAPGHGTDAGTLMRKADVALWQARQSGKTYLLYHANQDPYIPQRLALMGDFRKAIENGELRLYCQPKVHIASRVVTGVEALVRWEHPRYGTVYPEQFIPLVEPTDLIHLLTKFMLQAALGQCYTWRRQGIQLPIAVNLSTRNLLEPDLATSLEYLLLTWGAEPQWLGLEITESSLMSDPDKAIAELERLSKMGFRLYVDDFGTGYSSLSYLTRLPIDVIKIDHGFTENMTEDPKSRAVVKSTIDLAHNLGMTVVAEGTSNGRIMAALGELGCDEAQGHFISPPIPAESLTDWLAASGYGCAVLPAR